MNILQIGSEGQLAQAMIPRLEQLGELTRTAYELDDNSESQHYLDLADTKSIEPLLETIRPDVVVNTAAFTAVDTAESEPELAYAINGQAVGIIADWCHKADSRLIHVSTDYVFPGDGDTPYPEDATTAPVNAYGASKQAGEQAAIDSGATGAIVRSSWVYSATGQSFVATVLRLATERDMLSIVADQMGCPTYVDNLANVLTRLVTERQDDMKIYHYRDSGVMVWADFARDIITEAKALGLLKMAPRVIDIPSADYPTPAARPRYSVLDCNQLLLDYGIKPGNYRDSLIHCLSRMAQAREI